MARRCSMQAQHMRWHSRLRMAWVSSGGQGPLVSSLVLHAAAYGVLDHVHFVQTNQLVSKYNNVLLNGV
jgi:hypothetical protein